MTLAKSVLRGGRAGLVGIAALLAIGVGTGLLALSLSWRTDHAYGEYLQRSRVADLVVNPSLITDRADRLLRSTPGVISVRTDDLLVGTLDDGKPRPAGDLDQSRTTFVRGSLDGRYADQDRPVIQAGRMVRDSADEIFLSSDAADSLHLRVGDTTPLALWSGYTSLDDSDPTRVVSPAVRKTVRVAGIGVFADEVLADDLYPRARTIVSRAAAGGTLCTPTQPTDPHADIKTIEAQAYPAHCSSSYRYYSMRLAGGDRAVSAAIRHITAQLEQLNTTLPPAMAEVGVGYYLVTIVTADERARVERSLDPSVTALRIFGLGALGATLTVAVLAIFRWCRRSRPQAAVWGQLGATRDQRSIAVALPPLAASLAGLGVAVVAAYFASGVGPVASAGRLEPHAVFRLPWPVLALVASAALVVVSLGIAGSAVIATGRRSAEASRRSSQLAASARRSGNVPFALGLQATFRRGGSGALVGASVASVAAVLGSVIFSVNLAALVDHPARYGWSYDLAAITGAGYGGAEPKAIARSLGRPEVAHWGLAVLGAATVEGHSVPFVAARRGYDMLPMSIVSGRLPRGADEVAFGSTSAASLHLHVGDRVTVVTPYGRRTATVAAFVVLPPVGPIFADRAGLGVGVFLPSAFTEQLIAPAAREAHVSPEAFADAEGSFVAIDLRPGVDAGAFVGSLGGQLRSWETVTTGEPPFVYQRPVRPAQIADVAAMRSTPTLLTVLIAVAMALGLALALGSSVRERRREFAVLRALGATGRQLRATVSWQALAVGFTGLVLGVPLGVALGGATWRSFANDLGVVSASDLPFGWVAAMCGGTLLVALVASALPGRAVSRLTTAQVLRQE